MAVPGDADRAGQALVDGTQRGAQRTGGRRDLVQLVEVADGVQLQQVDVIGLQHVRAIG